MPSKAVKKNPVSANRAKKRLSLFLTGGIILALLAAGAIIAYSQVFQNQESRSQAAGSTNYCNGRTASGLINLDSSCGSSNGCKANERYQVHCENGRTISPPSCRKEASCPAYCRPGTAIPDGACGTEGCSAGQRPVYGCFNNLKMKGYCKNDVSCTGTMKPVNTGTTTEPTTGTTAPAAPAAPAAQPPKPTVADFGCRLYPTEADPVPGTYEFKEIKGTVMGRANIRLRCEPNQTALLQYMGYYPLVTNPTTGKKEYQNRSFGAFDASWKQQFTAPFSPTAEAGTYFECLPLDVNGVPAKTKCSYIVQ